MNIVFIKGFSVSQFLSRVSLLQNGQSFFILFFSSVELRLHLKQDEGIKQYMSLFLDRLEQEILLFTVV